MPKFPFMVCSNQTIAAVLSTHNSLQSSRNIAWTVNNGFRQLIAPLPMSISDMYIRLDTAPGVGTSRTFGTRLNLTNDNLSAVISDTETIGHDTSHVTVAGAGDFLDIYNVFTGSPATTALKWSCFEESQGQVMSSASGGVVSATNYTGLQSLSGGSATLSDVEQVMPTSGKIKNLYAYIGNNPITSGSYDVTLYVNGSPTALACNLSAANRMNSDTTHSVSVSEGDTVALQATPNSPSSNRTIEIACVFESDNPGEGVLLSTTGATAVTHSSKLYTPWYCTANLFNASATLAQACAMPVTFTKLYAKLGTAPGVGNTRTLALDNNGSDALSLTISGTNTSGSITGSHTPALGDLISLSSIRSASAAASTLKLGLVFQAYNSRSFFGMFN